MPTLTLQKDRREWHYDADRIPTFVKQSEEIATYSIDWTDELATGETISTSAWAGSPTTSGAAISGATTSVVVTGTGELKNTITTSTSRTIIRTIRFVEPNAPSTVEDYE